MSLDAKGDVRGVPLKRQSHFVSTGTDAAHSDGVMRVSVDDSIIGSALRHGPIRQERPEQPSKREDSRASVKSLEIPKQALGGAWTRVRANHGAPGVDKESLQVLENQLGRASMYAGCFYRRAASWQTTRKDSGTEGGEASAFRGWS